MSMGFVDRLRSYNIEQDFIELEKPEHEEESVVRIEVEKLQNIADTERIQRKLREGGVLLVKVRDLRSRDVSELRRAVERVKRTCHALDGDIAGLGEDWILACSGAAKVHRENA